MKTIQISDELDKYINDIIELIDDEYENFEEVVWALITVTNISKQEKYPKDENLIYG